MQQWILYIKYKLNIYIYTCINISYIIYSYKYVYAYICIYIYVYLGILSRPLTVCNYHHPNYHILSRGPYQLSLSTVTGRGSIPIYKRLQGFINISSIYLFSILFKSLSEFPLKILKGRWVYIAFSQKTHCHWDCFAYLCSWVSSLDQPWSWDTIRVMRALESGIIYPLLDYVELT